MQIGSALAMEPNDFVFPSYREHGVQVTRGLPMEALLGYWKGLPNSRWDVDKYRSGIITVPIATQLPHAVGYSYVAKLRGEDTVTTVYFGDGATSEADFHSGMNFAGVWKTPTVFICANNLYAISVPYNKQTAAETIAQKAQAYGFEGLRVDGMDPIAVYLATKLAVRRARERRGPTLIEAMTYRYGGHATADDDTLYRSRDEVEDWREKDPIERLRRFLENRGEWDERAGEKVSSEVTDSVDAAITAIEAEPLPERDVAVRHAFSRIPSHVVDQLHAMQRSHGEAETSFDDEEIWQVGRDELPEGPTELWNMAESINAGLHQAMERDGDVIILGEDVGVVGGVFRITEGLQERFGAGRVIDTPLKRVGDRGFCNRNGDRGSTTHRRNPIRGFCIPGLRSDSQPSRSLPISHPRQLDCPRSGQNAQRGGNRRPRTSLRLTRGLLRSRPRSRCDLSVNPHRRQGASGSGSRER